MTAPAPASLEPGPAGAEEGPLTLPASGHGWRASVLAKCRRFGGSPRRNAAAFALGVFLSFSPLLGLQIAIAIGLSLVLRLNRAALLIGLCTNLPWLMLPWYAVTTAAGAAALGIPLDVSVRDRLGYLFDLPVYRSAFWHQAFDLLSPFAAPFLFGSTVGAMMLGAAAYAATVRLMRRVHRTNSPC